MRRLKTFVHMLKADTRGATAVEYGLIIALVVLAVFSGIQALGSVTAGMWNNVSTSVINAR